MMSSVVRIHALWREVCVSLVVEKRLVNELESGQGKKRLGKQRRGRESEEESVSQEHEEDRKVKKRLGK